MNTNTIKQNAIHTTVFSRRRRYDLGSAVTQLLKHVLGCWHRQMSRPFTREGRTYRVCLSCGMSRDFDPATWMTSGPYRV